MSKDANVSSADTSFLDGEPIYTLMYHHHHRRHLLDLPDEVLVALLSYLPLLDLANVRLVCARLLHIADASSSVHLWANASMGHMWVTANHRPIIDRAADAGNVEALTKLAVAYLYSEGVADGPGKGTLEAQNGVTAANYLQQAEASAQHPFSWVLIRPPWSPNSICCKACVCHCLKRLCHDNSQAMSRLCYCIGKTLSFHEGQESEKALEWFEKGVEYGDSLHCLYEIWEAKHRQTLHTGEILSVRSLRKIVSQGGSRIFNAKFRLCEAYAQGFYGGIYKQKAFQFIQQVFSSSNCVLYPRVLSLQSDLTHSMRYILIDWLLEVAVMKDFPPATVHLAVGLFDRYILRRKLEKNKIQLLGITAFLVASRWLGATIITIREAAWLTDSTYKYEDVVKMMAELIAVLKGDIRRETIIDYLEIFFKLVKTSDMVKSMAYYISEAVLFHTEFGSYSAVQLAAVCFLNARIFLGQEYPWPVHLIEATGFDVDSLKHCCLMIYDRCLTDKYVVVDHRKVKLHSIYDRFGDEQYHCVSKHQCMSYEKLMESLGVRNTESPCGLSSNKKKLLSFINDSCYLSPPASPSHCLASANVPTSSPTGAKESFIEQNLVQQFDAQQKLSSNSSSSLGSTGSCREDIAPPLVRAPSNNHSPPVPSSGIDILVTETKPEQGAAAMGCRDDEGDSNEEMDFSSSSASSSTVSLEGGRKRGGETLGISSGGGGRDLSLSLPSLNLGFLDVLPGYSLPLVGSREGVDRQQPCGSGSASPLKAQHVLRRRDENRASRKKTNPKLKKSDHKRVALRSMENLSSPSASSFRKKQTKRTHTSGIAKNDFHI